MGILFAASPLLQPEPQASPAPPAVACVGGVYPPREGLPGWRSIFFDDFTQPVARGAWSSCTLTPFICKGLPEVYQRKWWAYPDGWRDTSRNGIYSPSKVISVADGVLDLYIHTEHGVHMVAALVPLINGCDGPLGQTYGRYAIRFRTDAIKGYKIAWLLWPDSETWPRDGEIDFPEGNLDKCRITGACIEGCKTEPHCRSIPRREFRPLKA